MTDPLGINAAFDRLAARQGCPHERWTKPQPVVYGHGRGREIWYRTKCRSCGHAVSRRSLAELLAALTEAPTMPGGE